MSNKEAIRHYAELFLGISKYIIYLVEIILDYFAVVPSSALISPIFLRTIKPSVFAIYFDSFGIKERQYQNQSVLAIWMWIIWK